MAIFSFFCEYHLFLLTLRSNTPNAPFMKRYHILLLLILASILHVFAKDDDPRNHAYYQIEYRWIPLMVQAYQEQEQTKELYPLNDLKMWNTYMQTHYPDIHEYFAWDSLQVYTYGQQSDSLNMIIYVFPEPFEVPLAAYGAVIIRPNAITYYTFEKSYDGYYVLGTMDTQWTHTNLGFYLPMPIEEFIGLVCEKENIPVIKQYPPEY